MKLNWSNRYFAQCSNVLCVNILIITTNTNVKQCSNCWNVLTSIYIDSVELRVFIVLRLIWFDRSIVIHTDSIPVMSQICYLCKWLLIHFNCYLLLQTIIRYCISSSSEFSSIYSKFLQTISKIGRFFYFYFIENSINNVGNIVVFYYFD